MEKIGEKNGREGFLIVGRGGGRRGGLGVVGGVSCVCLAMRVRAKVVATSIVALKWLVFSVTWGGPGHAGAWSRSLKHRAEAENIV